MKAPNSRLTGALQKVAALRGVNYRWRTEDFAERNFPEGRKLGLIAQEVEEVLPELVHTDNEGYKSLEYSELVAVLIEANKALQAKVEALKTNHQAELEALKAHQARTDALLAELQKHHAVRTASVREDWAIRAGGRRGGCSGKGAAPFRPAPRRNSGQPAMTSRGGGISGTASGSS